MIFQYNKYIFNIKFKQKIVFNTLPSFIFRNNIGFQLRKIVCVLRNSDCSVCILNATCIYPLMFETPIDKNNSFLKGRNRAPHPYVIYSEAKPEEKLDGLNLEIILIGSGIQYFPYIILAIMNVGKTGILRKRIQFDVEDIISQGISVISKETNSVENTPPLTWELDLDMDAVINKNKLDDDDRSEGNTQKIREIKIDFLSPLRIKRDGRYVSDIIYKDIIQATIRRIEILNSLFGSGGLNFDSGFINNVAENKKFKAELKWVDYERYSAKQKHSMQMGGIVGCAYVSGSFSNVELSLLRAAELFNIGKNVSFGLGRVRFHNLISIDK